MDLQERMSLKYIEIEPSGCWIWTGADNGRYGQIRINGKNAQAHRAAWELYFGEIPDGLLVLHRCDEPLCVNPRHLFLGTQAENLEDMVKKSRCCSPLTADEVEEIRSRYPEETQTELAKAFGVTQACISGIIIRKTWRLS